VYIVSVSFFSYILNIYNQPEFLVVSKYKYEFMIASLQLLFVAECFNLYLATIFST